MQKRRAQSRVNFEFCEFQIDDSLAKLIKALQLEKPTVTEGCYHQAVFSTKIVRMENAPSKWTQIHSHFINTAEQYEAQNATKLNNTLSLRISIKTTVTVSQTFNKLEILLTLPFEEDIFQQC